jgi:hypothetical protein
MVAMVAVLGFLATPVRAVPVTPTNFDTLGSLGAIVWGPETTSIFNGAFDGTLQGWVYDNAGTYTYKLVFEPAITDVLQFGAGFIAEGFTGVAGYSFSQATAAGFAPSPGVPYGFYIEDHGGALAWAPPSFVAAAGFWDNYEPMTFFMQTTVAPATGPFYAVLGDYHTGQGTFAPAPEPITLLLLAGGAAGIGVWERRRRT